MGGMGGMPILKKKKEEVKFDSVKATEMVGSFDMKPDDRMRQIDALRLYKPLPAECEELNMSDDRKSIADMKHCLELCGGCKGVRFSSDEIMQIRRSTVQSAELFHRLESHFLGMPSELRKLKLPKADGSENDSIERPTELMEFHALADEYLNLFVQFQDLVKLKREGIVPGAEFKYEKDPEMSKAKAMPDWLAVLVAKYNSAKEQRGFPAMTQGKLASFLSCCVVGLLECDTEVNRALAELVEASNDCQLQLHGDWRNTEGKPLETIFHTNEFTQHPQGYWAQRFFAFLSKMTELKSQPKDEKSLHNYEAFLIH